MFAPTPARPVASSLRARLRRAVLVLGALAWLEAAPALAAAAPPPVPDFNELQLPGDQRFAIAPGGELSWLGQRPIEPVPKGLPLNCQAWELVIERWNPATGHTAHTAVAPRLSGFVYLQLPLPAGVLALTSNACRDGLPRWRFVFLPADGAPALAVETQDAFEPMPANLLPLGDDAAVFVARRKDTRHIQVYTVQRQQGRLVLTTMPELPVAYRGDFAAAVAGGDQLMILGGSDGPYRGCSPCRSDTHLLDLKTRSWRAGPAMLEARSELAASTLPDGSVLVTGGWTQAAPWGGGASRSAERWNPATRRFEALPPMPNGTARHRHLVWNAPWGRELLVVPGMAGAVQSLDTRRWTWRTVGEWASGSEEGGCGFYPFVAGGHAFAWLLMRSEGHYSDRGCMEQHYASLSLLRPPATAAPTPDAPPEGQLISYRHGAAFLPASGAAPALIIGGALHAGMNSHVISGAVEAFGRDGRVATWPSLRTARVNARAFWVAGGVLVMGGTGPDSPYGGERDPKTLPAEWLPLADSAPRVPAAAAAWQEVDGAAVPPTAALTQLRDGSLLVLDAGGGLRQLRLVQHEDRPRLESSAWPALNRERREDDEGHPPQLQELDDGRVVVAGGTVRSERIALYSAQALKPGQPDEYVGIGPFLPWRRYEIFNRATGRWTTTAASVNAGGRALVMADGRVVKLGVRAGTDAASGAPRQVLEVSNPAGTAWSTLARSGARLKLGDAYRLFSLDGELLASGEIEGPDTDVGTGGVEWLNPATRQWELLWQAEKDDDRRKHQGRLLRRTLTGADGRAKTLVFPVGAW